jgi:phosphatidate phosphatase APP1
MIILKWLRLTGELIVKVYDGYGDVTQLIIYGHVLKLSPLPRKKYTSNWLTNTFSLLRLFIVRPKANAKVRMRWGDQTLETQTTADGFFHFEWKPEQTLPTGWHPVIVNYVDPVNNEIILATGKGSVFIPHVSQYACISDIDDTFLISHSSNFRKRLFVLLTENAQSRKPFEGVVKHYQLLSKANAAGEELNPFFYVSSSEWNLYDYIKEFSRKNELPPGIYLLNELKRLRQVLKSGQGKHKTKFFRIVRIIESFPLQKYILLGDDSQDDPSIYASVVEHFPDKIYAVYLRRVKISNESAVKEIITRIEEAGVACCYFTHSSEAIEHSVKIGLISL